MTRPTAQVIQRRARRLAIATAAVVFLVAVLWVVVSAVRGTFIRPAQLQDALWLAGQSLSPWVHLLTVLPPLLVALYWNFTIFVGSITLWGPWRGTAAFVLVHLAGHYFLFLGFTFALLLLWRLSVAASRAPIESSVLTGATLASRGRIP